MIVAIVIALAVVSLILAAWLGYSGLNAGAAVLGLIGLIALTMSVVTLFQSRRQLAEMKIEIPKVMTTIECRKCSTKTVREFQRGDFVFKELDACPKCPGEKQIITAIYKEVKEKEKTYAV
jgi:magnesium-transporting ATPase (P-type)